jgi:hypothetical protein
MTKMSAAQIAGLVKYHGASAGSSFASSLAKPDHDGPIFVAIALAESGGETGVTGGPNSNGTYDYGLWQINSSHKDLLDTYKPWSDPHNNFNMAVILYTDAGHKFTPWSSYNSGVYATHLAAAQVAWGSPDMSQADTNAVSDAANTTATAVANAASIGDLIAALTKSSTWVRVGMGAAGVLLLVIVVAAMVKTHIPLPGPVGAVAKAVLKK